MLEDGQEDAPEEVRAEQAGELGKAQAQEGKAAAESYEKRQMLWKGMAGRSWTELVQQWDVPQVEALQLQKSIASLMREIGPRLGDLHWKESTGLGRESRVLPEEAMGMLEAARTARRLREPGWCGEKGQGRWQAKELLEWAAKELTTSRRDLELQFGDIQDWAQRAAMDLTLERTEGKVEVHWATGHEDKRTTRRMMGTHQRGNVKAGANCTAVKRGGGHEQG